MVMTTPEDELFDTTNLWEPVEFDSGRTGMCDAYRHADGSITYIVDDDDGSHANPREDDGNVATLIQRNDRSIAIDTDDAGIGEARDRWAWLDQRHRLTGCGCEACQRSARLYGDRLRGHDREEMVRRYLRIFRPDIVLYVDYWSAGDSYGWGYITTEKWHQAMGEDSTYEPQKAFDAEVKLYDEWARGEVYGYVHEHPDGTEDSCWGFLGYDDHKDIAAEATDSPITETLY